MANDNDLVFNPVKYAEICEKKDKKERAKRNRSHDNFGCYYDENVVYGRVWEAVNEYRKTREW